MFYLTRVSYDNNTYEITIRTTEQAIKQIQFVTITISRFLLIYIRILQAISLPRGGTNANVSALSR
jgi:hypothetical protein